MKIVVIGGSGFIGTRLVGMLLKSGHDVKILDKRNSVAYPELTSIADVREKDGLAAALVGCDAIYNLAAEHRDDVTPRSLYDEVNVDGARNICAAADQIGVKRILFTSSVAVYGFAAADTDETGAFNPYNDYGRTKMLAEGVYREWLSQGMGRSLFIVRPTVAFGERNRGNVYNLLRQIASGRFPMVGSGKNVKSMCYVENIAAFLEFGLDSGPGESVFNYVDKPDMDMNQLVRHVRLSMGDKDRARIHYPYWLGYFGGLCFDLLAKLIGKKLAISSIRVKKFCSTTQFSSAKAMSSGFHPPVSLEEGIRRTLEFEFIHPRSEGDTQIFVTE
jgi:nucleoside-diphosphate-sugar epimerase